MKYFPHDERHKILIRCLKQIRIDAGLNQEAVAARLDRPQSYVSKYETGERRLDWVDVYLICNALEKSFSRFAQDYEKELKKR